VDWGSVAGSIGAILMAILIPLALKKRRKEAPRKPEEFLNHLLQLGVKASLLEKGAAEEKAGVGRASGQRSEGVIGLEGKNVAFINIVSLTSQYGVQYFLNYLVKSAGGLGKEKKKRTRMVKKTSSIFGGRVVDIEWRGDDYLSRGLNMDYRLKDYLLQAEPEELKGSIWIFPEPKHEYARIRTGLVLPSVYFFEAIDIIAGHIKSGW
jgi:hypothetical protein